MSQTSPGYSPPLIKQKFPINMCPKVNRFPRYPLLCRNTRNAVINKKHATMSTEGYAITRIQWVVRKQCHVNRHRTLTGTTYREILERLTQDILPDVPDDVPLQLRVGMWFMHDGAPPHFSSIARQYLNDQFPGKWIGRNGPVEWPPRSPDLNPIDFYIWGHVKSEVYSTPVTNVDELWERTVATFGAIRNRPGQLERVRESMMRRLNGCVAANGQHFEHLM